MQFEFKFKANLWTITLKNFTTSFFEKLTNGTIDSPKWKIDCLIVQMYTEKKKKKN